MELNPTLHPPLRTRASAVLRKVERDFRLKNAIVEGSGVGSDVTFVGVHDRRTDYLEFRRKRLKLRDLYRGYFEVRWVWELETQIPRLGPALELGMQGVRVHIYRTHSSTFDRSTAT